MRARPGSVRLVAAKTEGDEMGQYVMALYRKRWLHLRAPISLRGCVLHGAHASWPGSGGVAVEFGGEPVDPHEAQHFVAAGPCTLDRLLVIM